MADTDNGKERVEPSGRSKPESSMQETDLLEVGEGSISSETLVDMTEVEGEDPALSKKVHLINNAIDEIGFTWMHAVLFCIAGFGYSADSQMEVIQASVYRYVDLQFRGPGTYPLATQISYAALVTGCIVFGFGADLIGRKICFNSSLILSSVFGLFTGGAGSYAIYVIFFFLSELAAGGNLSIDISVFMEYLPSKYQYLNTTMAAWWGVGQTIAALMAWAFIPNNSCSPDATTCTSRENRGWRYVWYVNSAMILFVGLVRLFILRLKETPKFLVSNGRDREAYENLLSIAKKYNRKCSLTLEDLTECGEIKEDYYDPAKHGRSLKKLTQTIGDHIKILFSSRKVTRSTTLLLLSWAIIGLAYSTFYNFLYIYIAAHGASGLNSKFITYRNGTIDNMVGIFGPIAAGWLIKIPRVGRRGTMIFGSLSGMAVVFAYTTCRTAAADAGFGSATYFFINIYYACLYAYTPEVFPTRARTTGVALCMICGRVAGAFSTVIYWYSSAINPATPIWVCGALIGCLSILAFFMPFEPSKQRTV
ncbi:DEKNAAC102879 [Brettanomyces naardenensis]|uniref:DEKNAAC102879 n=1 Tax=Brettanomyces naardenensis TaxID=13370 RepID=A0A448YLV6_BRENA|nr:DEKNAAC102879 [Brettanomyces naardenensis]